MCAASEESVRVPKQGVRRTTDGLPLSFVLKGKSWGLTTFVQASMALWVSNATCAENVVLMYVVSVDDKHGLRGWRNAPKI